MFSQPIAVIPEVVGVLRQIQRVAQRITGSEAFGNWRLVEYAQAEWGR